jgi:hypothetical protein
MKQYKVMTQKDRYFGGKFDPEKLEGAMNAYAAEGWGVRAVATAEVRGIGGSREELVVIFERDALAPQQTEPVTETVGT